MVRRMSLLDRDPVLDYGEGEDPIDEETIAAMEDNAGALPAGALSDIALPTSVRLVEAAKPEDDYYELTDPNVIGMGV